MALTPDITTANAKFTWCAEFYPFANPDPSDDQGSNLAPPPISIIGSQELDPTTLYNSFEKTGLFKQSGLEVQKGLVSLSINRSKASPSGSCNLSFVGPVPQAVVVGTWVVISSINYGADDSPTQLIKFIGQIYTSETNYMIQASGLLTLVTNVGVREWSDILNCAVRFDLLAVQNTAAQDALGASQLISAIGQDTPSFGIDGIVKAIKEVYSPFEYAHLILTLVGCINTDDKISKIVDLNVDKFPEVALTMPSVPKRLLDRLGLPDADPKQPFASSNGLVKVITGIQTSGFKNDGTWNGIFDFFELNQSYPLNENPSDRPVSSGLSSLLGLGQKSAWELLNENTDPVVNEIFTDIVHIQYADGSIVAQPTIFVRDTPFNMKKLIGGEPAITAIQLNKNWTKYDDLPRVRLNNALITGFKIHNTFLGSPNLIRIGLHSEIGAKDIEGLLSASKGAVRLRDHMRRWGGQEKWVQSSFYGITPSEQADPSNVKFRLEEWMDVMKSVIKIQHAYNYRMGDGTVIMRYNGETALTVGFNAQFTFGNLEVVGHIDSISIHFQVDAQGIEQTSMEVGLVRIVQATPDGDLDFIGLKNFGNMHLAEGAPTQNLADLVAQGAGAISGVLSDNISDLIPGLS